MKQESIAPEFFKNSFHYFICFFINHLGGAIFTILVARILAPEIFGVYTLALSVIVILMTIGDMGINEALIKYVSSNSQNKPKANSYFFYILKIKTFLLLCLSAILIISSKLIASFYNNENLAYVLIIGSFYLFFYSMMQFISSLFYAFKNIKAYICKESLFQTIRLFLIPLLLIFSFGYLAAGPIILIIISSIITLIFLIFYLLNKYPDIYKSPKTKIDKKEFFNFVKYLSLGSLSVIFLVHTDILILGKFVDLDFLGFYRAASSTSIIFSSFLTLTAILYPIFTQIDKKRIKKVFDILLYYLFIFSIPITLGVFIFSKQIIQLLFGTSYIPASIILSGLAFLIFVYSAGELFRALLNSKGKSKQTGKVIFYASILNIFLNFILIYLFLLLFQKPIYAALGAGIATVISRGFIFISLAKTSKKKFNVRIKSSYIIKPLIASIAMVLFLFLFTRFIYNGINIIIILFEIIVAVIIYFTALYLIKGIYQKDVRYIVGMVRGCF